MWAGSHDAGNPSVVDPAEKYPVLLLNEEQIARLMQRQSMRQVHPRVVPGGSSTAAYVRWMRRGRVALATFGVLIAGAAAIAWAPRPALALPWMRAAVAPTIATGASFSATVASPRTADEAAAIVGRLGDAGIAAFTRAAANKQSYQVLAGPYVSLDEAERMQRVLAAGGFGGSRLFVDDSVRQAPRNDAAPSTTSNPGIVLVGAPGRLSLVFEMRSEPRQVTARRADDTTIDVHIGPLDAGIPAQHWSAPAGVHLIRAVALEQVGGTGPGSFARATLTVPEFARANTRVEGRRVYVDLTWPAETIAAAAAPARSSPRAAAPATAAAVTAARQAPGAAEATAASAVQPAPVVVAAPEEPLAPLIEQFGRILPFVQSAAKTPTPDVMQALSPTLAQLDAGLKAMTGSTDAAARGLLISATASARRAVDPGFTGDRVAQGQQAAGLYEAASALLN